jgi:preprotein translocase subunit SecG
MAPPLGSTAFRFFMILVLIVSFVVVASILTKDQSQDDYYMHSSNSSNLTAGLARGTMVTSVNFLYPLALVFGIILLWAFFTMMNRLRKGK